jgi:hypothetical protein
MDLSELRDVTAATPSTRTIDRDAFHARMREHWQGELANVYTSRIGEQWFDLSDAFNTHITRAERGEQGTQYSVVAAPLGSGKTQGLIIYCVMLAEQFGESAPGVLIVTRLIRDADAIAEQINRMAGREVALAYHFIARKERKVTLAHLSRYQVAVVTHNAYRDALDELAQGGRTKWPEFSAYGDGERALNVIDEALDMVEHDHVGVDQLNRALGHIPNRVRQRFPEEVAALRDTLDHLCEISTQMRVPGSERPRLQEMVRSGTAVDLSGLMAHVGCTRLRDCDETAVKQSISNTLRSVERLWRQWCYVSTLPTGEDSLHTARLILPSDTRGAVILDATSRANRLYDLLGDRIVRRKEVAGVRSWKNVTIYASKGHKVGKAFVEKAGETWAREAVSELLSVVDASRRVLLIAHATGEPLLKMYAPEGWHAAHWGAIDGSNEWRDCDTVAILSLLFRPDYWATNAYFAMTGDLDESLIAEEGKEQRWQLKRGQIVSDVVQAIGRARCRKVVDVEGNCAPTDVYLRLPAGTMGDQILGGIIAELPGVCVVEGDYAGSGEGQSKVRRKASKNEEAFVAYCGQLTRGTHDAALARQRLALRGGSWRELVAKLRDPASTIAKQLSALGVAYFVTGDRGQQQAVLVRA